MPPKIPPTVFDPEEMSRIQKVSQDPTGVPVHHTTIDADERHEESTLAMELAPDYRWFYLGFAYCLIKIDRSLFEVFQAAANLTIPIRTHRAPDAIAKVAGVDFAKNPWAYIIQGIPLRYATTFADFVASYQFVRKDTGESWCCNFKEIRIADPMIQNAKRGVGVMFALPGNLTKKRHLEPGPISLFLDAPVFRMADG